MTRREIVTATYEAAAALNDIKRRHQLIDDATFLGVAERLYAARQLFEHADDPSALTHAVLELANHRTMFGDDELKWPVAGRFRVGAALLRGLASGLVQEVGHTAARAVGRYDTAARMSR